MGRRTGLALAAALVLLCCAAAQPTLDQADDEGALEPNGRKVLGVIGPFQQKVLAAGAVGLATGGPSGAVMNMGGTVLGNHAIKKKWPGFGRKMLGFGDTSMLRPYQPNPFPRPGPRPLPGGDPITQDWFSPRRPHGPWPGSGRKPPTTSPRWPKWPENCIVC